LAKVLQYNTKKIYPDSPRLAVGAIVLREGRVLLVKRGNAPAKGMWPFQVELLSQRYDFV